MRNRTLTYLASAVALVVMTASGCSAPSTGSAAGNAPVTNPADVPAKPSAPVTLNILDVAGNQKLTGPMVDAFVKANPDVISSVTWETAGAPDLVGTIKPQVDSKKLSVDLVMTGTDGLSAGISQKLWMPLVTDYGDRLSNQANYLEPAAKMQELAEGYGPVTTYYPSGPLLQYDPKVVDATSRRPRPSCSPGPRPTRASSGTPAPPTPAPAGRSSRACPTSSATRTRPTRRRAGTRPGPTSRSSAQYVDNYPTGTGQVISNMADGTWAMIPTTTGWDIEPRADGEGAGHASRRPRSPTSPG